MSQSSQLPEDVATGPPRKRRRPSRLAEWPPEWKAEYEKFKAEGGGLP